MASWSKIIKLSVYSGGPLLMLKLFYLKHVRFCKSGQLFGNQWIPEVGRLVVRAHLVLHLSVCFTHFFILHSFDDRLWTQPRARRRAGAPGHGDVVGSAG